VPLGSRDDNQATSSPDGAVPDAHSGHDIRPVNRGARDRVQASARSRRRRAAVDIVGWQRRWSSDVSCPHHKENRREDGGLYQLPYMRQERRQTSSGSFRKK
jgi:hypothetical protein